MQGLFDLDTNWVIYFYAKPKDSINPILDFHSKVWILALWWAMKKGKIDFIFKGKGIHPINNLN